MPSEDGFDTVTGEMVDVGGGWHDAGDRLKHMITTSYCVAALFLAGAKTKPDHGARLIKKIHPNPQTIYVQIGDDRDHMPPDTLWHDDKSDYGRGPGGRARRGRRPGRPKGRSTRTSRPAWRTSPAAAPRRWCSPEMSKRPSRSTNLAKAKPGVAMSVPVRAPYYYGESSYFDDMEWGATELYLATKDKAVSRRRDPVRRSGEATIPGWEKTATGTTSSSPT